MRSANCTSVVLTALLACACDSNPSGSDAQSHPGAGQTPPVLGAPQNLHAIRAPLIVGLFWNPVEGATSYVISGIPHVRGGVAQLIGEVTSTGVAIRFTSDAFPIDFAVTAKSAAGLGGPTGIFVPLPPSLDA